MTKYLLIAITAIGLTSCGPTQVLAGVEATLNAVAALQTALPAAGVSPELAKEIGEYASAAAAGTAKCASDLAAGGDTVTLVAKCGQYLSTAILPILPAGTPLNIVGLVATIYAEIQVVYAAIEANSTGTSTGTGVAKAAVSTPAKWQPSKRESNQLKALAVRAGKLAKT